MSINEKLMIIQSKLKSKKGQLNKFGGYNYRSLEDIYEALKPLLLETKTNLVINNDLEVFAERIFRKSTATLTCIESAEERSVYTYTQESIERKGMSAEQCSGSTASYSDKYCLNKLFSIDDTKDADATNNHGKENVAPPQKVQQENKPIEVKKPSGFRNKKVVNTSTGEL